MQLLILRYNHAVGLSSLLVPFTLTVVHSSLAHLVFPKYCPWYLPRSPQRKIKLAHSVTGPDRLCFWYYFDSFLANCVRAAQIQQKTRRERTIYHIVVVVICAGSCWATFVSVATLTIKRCEPAFSVFSFHTFHSRQCTYTELESALLSWDFWDAKASLHSSV